MKDFRLGILETYKNNFLALNRLPLTFEVLDSQGKTLDLIYKTLGQLENKREGLEIVNYSQLLEIYFENEERL